jgi:RNA polymerase sigma-70 factor (ECF subfamily)
VIAAVTDLAVTKEFTPVSQGPVDFQTVFKSEASFVWHTLRRLGVPSRDLEDITHDVFLAVFRRLPDYDPARPIRPWLFGISYRTMLRYKDLARHQREVSTEAPDHIDERPGADEQMAQAQTQQKLTAALATLQLDQRAVFIMHDIEEYSMPDIADTLSVPLNTAYSRLRLARTQLRSVLMRQASEDTP